MAIPSVDLADFLYGKTNSKSTFVKALGNAYEEVGFVAVKNHGVPYELIIELYKQLQQFFSLPLQQKKCYEDYLLAGQRGYSNLGKEHAKGFEVPDLKEFYPYGQVRINFFNEEEYPFNISVKDILGFNEVFEQVYRSFENPGKFLLQAIFLYLDLNEFYFDDYIANGNSILRAIHYPPITAEPVSSIRAEQHEDINLITLLVGVLADGLQILNKKNEWIPVTSLPEQIVVNVGDMLQRLTNNKLYSTTQRVVNPDRALWHTSRFSIPFFLHPKSSMSLCCLDYYIEVKHSKFYKDATAGEYLEKDYGK